MTMCVCVEARGAFEYLANSDRDPGLRGGNVRKPGTLTTNQEDTDMQKNVIIAEALVETIRVITSDRPTAIQYHSAAAALRQAGEFCRLMAERLDAAAGDHRTISAIHATPEVAQKPQEEMSFTKMTALAKDFSPEHKAILAHTAFRNPKGFFCGDSPEMQDLVRLGFMKRHGKISWCPDEYFEITPMAKLWMAQQ